jgi:hypothetical protein
VGVCVGGGRPAPRTACDELRNTPALLKGCCVEVLGGLKEPSMMSPRLQIIQGSWFALQGRAHCPPALYGHTRHCVSQGLGTRPPEATTVAEHEFKLAVDLLSHPVLGQEGH